MHYLIVAGDITAKEYSPLRAQLRLPDHKRIRVHRVPTLVLDWHDPTIDIVTRYDRFVAELPCTTEEIIGVIAPATMWQSDPVHERRAFDAGNLQHSFPNLPHVSLLHREDDGSSWIEQV